MPFLLATDLDNTLIGDNQATILLNQYLSSIRNSLYLVYATGRSLDSVRRLMQKFQDITGKPLLEPDYIVAGVGSEIYHQDTLDHQWSKYLSQNWQPEKIKQLLELFPELILQPQQNQNHWKVSYYAQSNNNNLIIQNLCKFLAHQGLEVQVIFSCDRDVDILPKVSGKGQAVSYLGKKLNIPAKSTLVCGDSGNDITMFEQGTLGAIVNNSQPELLHWHYQNFLPDNYLCKSNYAEGILEAIAYFQQKGFIRP